MAVLPFIIIPFFALKESIITKALQQYLALSPVQITGLETKKGMKYKTQVERDQIVISNPC